MYIAYYRVSTRTQGESGLGLQSQQSIVKSYAGEHPIIAEYTDIESGKSDTRQELIKALEHCRKDGLILLIAKLDRLSRNLTFISSLMDSQVKFVCCDMPQANEFTLHIFAALAQQERKMISERTKAALTEKKKNIGEWRKGKIRQYQYLGVAKIKDNAANNNNNKVAKEIAQILKDKGYTLQQIADRLNDLLLKTSRNKSFHKTTVSRLISNILNAKPMTGTEREILSETTKKGYKDKPSIDGM